MVSWFVFIHSTLFYANTGLPGSGVGHSVGAGSPFNNYTAAVAFYMIIAGFLVSILLIGGFLILNIGMMSKRLEDRVGKRDPSDLELLNYTTWPEAPYKQTTLPAEEEEEQQREAQQQKLAEQKQREEEKRKEEELAKKGISQKAA